jgi:enoyl-CoA hydratase
MSDQVVLTERRDGVLIVTLNRPDARNAVNSAVAQGIADALDVLDDDDALQVGVLTGAGKGFSAGMDLRAFVQGERPYVEGRGFAGITQRAARKPLIAAVEGFAVAGGFEIALSCDLIVASRGTRFGIPEVKRGLIAGAGGLLRIPQRVPHGIAMEMALTGDLMQAERGYELGLVNRLTEPGGALDGALELAAAVSVNGPLALTASKEILLQVRDWSEAEFWERQAPTVDRIFASEDAREGATALTIAPTWGAGRRARPAGRTAPAPGAPRRPAAMPAPAPAPPAAAAPA